MDCNKILIVTASFYPQNSPRSFRATELAKEFSRQGHQVTVLTPKDPLLHKPFGIENHIEIKDLGKRKWRSIKNKGNGLYSLIRRFFIRFSKLLFEYPEIELFWMVRKALRNESGYDMMISIAVPYPIHWGVAASISGYKKAANVWIADCGDPYMGQENDSFKPSFWFKWVEKWFMSKTDFVTVPTEGAISAYYPEFHSKIRVIPQGFKFEEYSFPRTTDSNSKPIFAYAGMFIPGRRDPSEFISYLKQKEIDYEFHIYTKTPQFVRGITDEYKNKIILHDSVPREVLLEILSGMDFLVNFDNVGNKQTPSKLIDYLILGKPVLSVTTGRLDIKVIDEFLSGDYKNRVIIKNPDQYRIERVCGKFLKLTYTRS